jgi:chromatin remodeling complex protein RSC6
MAKKGFDQKLEVSSELYDVIGVESASRGEVMKKVWAYIKKHKLQDPDDKRTILPDELLGEVIGHNPIDMFKMTAKISKHLS